MTARTIFLRAVKDKRFRTRLIALLNNLDRKLALSIPAHDVERALCETLGVTPVARKGTQ